MRMLIERRFWFFAVVLLAPTHALVGCSDGRSSGTTITVKDNRLTWATVEDTDGIRSITGLQRIPRGGAYLEYSVDFKFNEVGAKSFDIYIGGMFDTVGTAVHVDVADMKGNNAYLFIRSTAQGFQTGTYRKQ